jgi:hypothetical protein
MLTQQPRDQLQSEHEWKKETNTQSEHEWKKETITQSTKEGSL